MTNDKRKNLNAPGKKFARMVAECQSIFKEIILASGDPSTKIIMNFINAVKFRCFKCGCKIVFDRDKVSDSGKHIPLNESDHLPHQCPTDISRAGI